MSHNKGVNKDGRDHSFVWACPIWNTALCLRLRYQTVSSRSGADIFLQCAWCIAMYSQPGAPMAPPQKPETFMLSTEAQQSLPQDAQVALQQVDNCKSITSGIWHSRVMFVDTHPT